MFMALYLMMLDLAGKDEHNEFLANPVPQSPQRKGWQSKETFVGMSSYLKPDLEILNALEERGWIEQPQKYKKWREQTYIQVSKEGMQRARELLLKIINLDGVEAALVARAYHDEYISHKLHDKLHDETPTAEEWLAKVLGEKYGLLPTTDISHSCKYSLQPQSGDKAHNCSTA
jgi:hypothetical protein